MNKPINKIALALWILAAVYAAGELWSYYAAMHLARDFQSAGNSYAVTAGIGRVLESTIMGCGQLVAFGTLIELVDQIRWNAIKREK